MRQAYRQDRTPNQYLANKTKQQTYKEVATTSNITMAEMENEAYSVKDFFNRIWIKLGNGDWVLNYDPTQSKSTTEVYFSAKTVMNSQRRLIAKRLKEPNKSIISMIKKYDDFRSSDYELRRVKVNYRKTVETYDKSGHKITGEN